MSSLINNNLLSSLLIQQPIKRKVFVSYHHDYDQPYYDKFSELFADQLQVISDNSLERAIQSDDIDYVRWAIKQNNIKGSSCTIVLCGKETHLRKYVDWEIKATLEEKHGLIGITLPTSTRDVGNNILVPDRYFDNYQSGYASWIAWTNLSAQLLKTTIENAVIASKSLINNGRAMRWRNG